VSSGTEVPVGVRFADNMLLVTYALPSLEFSPGDAIPLTLLWQASGRVAANYQVFVHLTDEEGRLLAQHDAPLVGGSGPTGAWNAGTQVRDLHMLAVPSDLGAGTYRLVVGLYGQSGRLGILDAGRLSVDDDAAVLTQIELR
jgi:hypothetical protein